MGDQAAPKSTRLKLLQSPDEALDDWLFPPGSEAYVISSPACLRSDPDRADIYAIAFQEIVELTAGQILQTDPAKRCALSGMHAISQILKTFRRRWEKYIMDTFAMRKDLGSEYGLFRSDQVRSRRKLLYDEGADSFIQLVGTALVVVVKSDLMKHIRAVETATKKVRLFLFLEAQCAGTGGS